MFVANQKLNSIIKTTVPRPTIMRLLSIYSRLKAVKAVIARGNFNRAPETPVFLEANMLDLLQQVYPFPPEGGYDLENLEKKGEEHAKEILSLIHKKNVNTFLELGCGDGMVSCFLQRMGKITTAIDIRTEGFNVKAVRQGIRFLQMDASHLGFIDESFDFVFSYASFEHFFDPEVVLSSAIRVLKPGGYLYLFFGPLYMSPFGLHAYRSISVPYCQFLFPKEVLQDFTNARGLGSIEFANLNGWSLEEYRKLWERYSYVVKRVRYSERYDVSHTKLITRYPSCFKSKTKYFDNLLVSEIEALFKKIG